MASLEEFCRIRADLAMEMIGKVPAGVRIDFPFEGVATSSHWEGERRVRGVDHVTVRGDGHMALHIHGTIGEGDEVVAYEARGVSIAVDRTTAEPRELVTFETPSEELSFLNTSIGVALGRGERGVLELTVYLVKP